MPFTSDTGRLAGQKSKRGQGLARQGVTSEIKPYNKRFNR